MNFREEQKKRTEWTEEVIREFLPKEEGYQKEIMEAMNYSVLAGGKRLRPLMMYETYRMFGGEGEVIRPFMAAMEMIHTYSLVHDDLPAMDNDEYRRGKLTTHAKYGHAMGILAGDALLNFAFETAASAFDYGEDPGRVAKALQILAKKAGVYGMIGGQVVDVQSSGHAISKERLDFIYKLKTSALLEAAMMTGAVLTGAAEEEVRTIEQVASDVGVAFQVRDDILDVTGTLESIGKPVHSDDKNEKTTYVTLKGLEQASADVEELSDRALRNLASLPYKNEFLTELIQSLVYRDR
ncbi:farnesyl-diphosphate synthase [Lachnoclostridium sp. An196]|uniref:polyprenyl synthetase family protein n=1 Tax=Lachnoclostridium sp. An196 TaxID=1965583 RepID=UPI000B36D08D|nr:farnesyl diphosphate synthase [Lachnoclostridium sp. An196]OUP19098.1 farnesyl-diphosphate synthase [Lachnoclostridium sp. An196]